MTKEIEEIETALTDEIAAELLTDEQKEALEKGEDITLTDEQAAKLFELQEQSDDGIDLDKEVDMHMAASQDKDFIPPHCIKLPADIDLVKFVQDVYALSKPQGLGHTKFTPGDLPESEAKQILKRNENNNSTVVSMDYVNGRACKMTVQKNEAGSLFIADTWFDHTKAEFRRLLQRSKVKGVDIERDKEAEKEIEKQRNANPFSTQEGVSDND